MDFLLGILFDTLRLGFLAWLLHAIISSAVREGRK